MTQQGRGEFASQMVAQFPQRHRVGSCVWDDRWLNSEMVYAVTVVVKVSPKLRSRARTVPRACS